MNWQQELGALAPQLAAIGVHLSPAQTGRLQLYCEHLAKWNRAFNLVSRRDLPRLASRHIFDCLTGATLLSMHEGANKANNENKANKANKTNTANKTNKKVLDVGSGAGLPGIPLAVCQPQMEFVLLDRNQRRTRFLQQVVTKMALSNVQVVCCDLSAATAVASVLGPFDIIVSRGVLSAPRLWPMIEHLFKPQHGCLLVYESTQVTKVDEAAMQATKECPKQLQPTAHPGVVDEAVALPAGVSVHRHYYPVVATGQIHAILQLRRH